MQAGRNSREKDNVNSEYDAKIRRTTPEWDDRHIVYCDGASKNNGKQHAVAGVGVWWNHDDPRYVVFST